MSRNYTIEFTPKATAMLEAITDVREREGLLKRIEELATDPEMQGKALRGELQGHRSVRAVVQRYRIVYQVLGAEVVVLVIGVARRREGNRRDVYAQVERLTEEERERPE